MKQARGFTLIELLMTIVIAAILAALAAPSFTSFIKNNRLTTTTNDLLADLALARSEAAKRGQRVKVCIGACVTTTTCSCATGGTDWLAGRLIFPVTNVSDPSPSNVDALIRVTEAKSNGTVLSAYGFANGAFITYSTTGTVSTGNVGTFKICDDRAGPYGKLVQITNNGRPNLQTAQSCP